MTNKEIIQSVRSKYVTDGQVTMYTTEQISFMLNMLREEIKNQMLDGVMTDSEFEEYTGSKRDQPQGVNVSVSWSGGIMYEHRDENHSITIPMVFANFLGLTKGECAKFKIVRLE